jgi:CheY-like chemotaxis protein
MGPDVSVPNDSAGESPSAEVQPPSSGPPGAATVLVVDNEAVVRRLAQIVLERHGYAVLGAENGREAVEVYRRERDRIAVVLLDWLMPVLSGAEALAELRRLNPQVRVVLTSGGLLEPGMVPAEAAESAPPPVFLPKPYRSADLLAAIAAARAGGSGP